jgi:hypothetical protein
MKIIETNEPFVLLNNLTGEQIRAVRAIFDAKIASKVEVIQTPNPSETPLVTPSVIPSISSLQVSNFKISVACDVDGGKQKNISWTTNVPSEVLLGTYVGGNSLWMPSSTTWKLKIREIGTGNYVDVEVNSGACGAPGSYKIGGTTVVSEVTTVTNTSTVVTSKPIEIQTTNSFALKIPQLNIAPLNQRIKLSKKIQFQTSAWSAGRSEYGNSGMKFQLSRDGRVIYNLEASDNEFPKEMNNAFNLGSHPDDLKNNHPTSTRLILPEGTYKVEYQNNSNIDYPIVLTLIDAKDAAYFVYYPCGLKKPETLFYKQLNKGESITANLTLHDTVGVVKQQGENLHRGVFINFIVDGKISLERFQVDFGNNQYQTFDYFRAVSATEISKLRYVMEKDHSKFIEIAFYPNSDEFEVISKNGIDVAEEHVDLTQSVFQLVNYGTNGVKFSNFKMTNNAGYEMKEDFGSIMQKKNGELVENGDENIVIPFINGKYQSTQQWRYNCEQ